jgi:hypothetical protein
VDTQSRGIRLPASGRRSVANSNPDSDSDSNSNCHRGSISNADCHGNGYCYPDTVWQANSDSATSADYTSASVVL